MKESITGLGANAPVDVVRKFMELSFRIFQTDQEKYSAQFEEDYGLVGQSLDAIIATGNNVEPAQSVKAYADRMFAASGAADCATMDEKFASKVVESANDIETLTSIVRLYRRMGCLDSKVYFDASLSIHKLQPTSESAAGCAQMCLKKGDKKGGIDYYQQALSMATSKDDKADYLYRLANIYVSMGSYQQGASYANQALSIDPDNGRCYLLLAMCYGSAKISSDPVLGRAVFWVACDMCVKAKQVDSSCARDADRLYAKYRAHFPSKEDIFFSKAVSEGSSYFVGGWIGRSTIVRSR
jgi:tetratricopeptide (TPR) repeat protein